MQSLLAGLMNWKTTLAGVLAALSNLVTSMDKLGSGSPTEKANVIMASIGAIVVGVLAKDADKTGILGKKNE